MYMTHLNSNIILESKKRPLNEGLQYHIDTDTPIHKNVYRYGSNQYFELFIEARELYNKGVLKVTNEDDRFFLESDIGDVGIYNGKKVVLDFPIQVNEESLEVKHLQLMRKALSAMPRSPRQKKIIKQLNSVRKELGLKPLKEAVYDGEEVELNSPKRGGSKKYYVYVNSGKKTSDGKVKAKKVSFGADDGGQSLSVKLKDKDARKAFADRHNCSDKTDKKTAGYWSCNLPKYADDLGLEGGGDFYW